MDKKPGMPDHMRALWDERLMALALRLGRRTLGNTAENPAVGCVLAHLGSEGAKIVGRGATQRSGRPHAERVALAEAGELARGATAYVTLEPCSHHGKTPPCATGLIEAGVARVVCAHPDPDPRVAGRGITMLRDAGIEVDCGLMRDLAHYDLAGFLSRTMRKRPWLQAKMALSADGMVGRRDRPNLPITGPLAKQRTYGLRARADAILVGIDTVLIDDPALTVRTPGLEDCSPIRVVLDSSGRTPLEARLVKTANEVPSWIITSDKMPDGHREVLETKGCRILTVPLAPDGHIDLSVAMQALAEAGINRVFAECGAILAGALLKADLVDEFILYRGASEVGEGGLKALEGDAEACLARHAFVCDKSEQLGPDRLQIHLRPDSLTALD